MNLKRLQNISPFGIISPLQLDLVGVAKRYDDACAFQLGRRDLVQVEGVPG